MATDFALIVYVAGIATGISICAIIAMIVQRLKPADGGELRQTAADPTLEAYWWKRGEDGPPEWGE